MLSISARPITATTAASTQRPRAPRPVSHMIRCQGTTDGRDQTPQKDTPIRARIASGVLAATMLVASVLPPAHAANGNAAALLVEIQETELPGLQSDVGKINDPTVGAKVERRLNEIEAQVATIAEKYEQGKIIPAGLAIQTSQVLNDLNRLKGEMRAHE